LVRKLLCDILSSDPEIEVVGTASNGLEAIRSLGELKPDVVTMDIHMPEMDGLSALEYIMRRNPLPVVMLSALAQKGAAPTLKALELGAVDFIAKPSHFPSAVREIRDEVLVKVKTAARASGSLLRLGRRKAPRRPLPRGREAKRGKRLVIIGASAGGPRALAEIMPLFPKDMPAALVIVQHMPGVFTRSFAQRLDSISRLKVKEAGDGEVLGPGTALVAPGGKDLVISRRGDDEGWVETINSPNKAGATPRIDTTMITGAESFGPEAIGVIMTGMGSDGALGMETIKKRGGDTLAQDNESCLVFGMPKVAIERGVVDWVLPLEKIPEKIQELL
jgi:two-component system chemotaxis response regulator CheB